MKQHAEDTISDEDFAKAAERWPKDTPQTKEAYLIRATFDRTSSVPLLLSQTSLKFIKRAIYLRISQSSTRPKPRQTPPSDGSPEETGAALLIPPDAASASTTLLITPRRIELSATLLRPFKASFCLAIQYISWFLLLNS